MDYRRQGECRMSRLTYLNESRETTELTQFEGDSWEELIKNADTVDQIFMHNAIDKLYEYEDLEEQGLLLKEEDVLKFYYCESLDKYLVGKRLDTMYYADITDMGDLHFFMSRYLPWGENTYPSEPKEIPFTEWLNGFTKQRELKEGIE
jgi:hypothetical protein